MPEKLFNESMPLRSHLFRCLRVHFITKMQEFVVKVLYRCFKRTSMFSAVRKCSRNAYGAYAIKPVGILYDPAFDRLRALTPVFAEGYAVYDGTDPFDHVFREVVSHKKTSGICIVFRIEQFVIVGIVQKRAEGYDQPVTSGLFFCDLKCIPVHSQCMCLIMSAIIRRKTFLYVAYGFVYDLFHISPAFLSKGKPIPIAHFPVCHCRLSGCSPCCLRFSQKLTCSMRVFQTVPIIRLLQFTVKDYSVFDALELYGLCANQKRYASAAGAMSLYTSAPSVCMSDPLRPGTSVNVTRSSGRPISGSSITVISINKLLGLKQQIDY